MSPRELVAYVKGSGVHIAILAVGLISAYILVGKFKSGELSFGGASLEKEIANQEKEVQELKKRMSVGKERLAKRAKLDEKAEELAVMETEIKELLEANMATVGKLESLKKGLTETDEMFESYRKRYRAYAREKAVGTKMEKLTTLTGKTYEQVTIKSIGALGLNITHKDGSRRIPFKDLPERMQRQYQFDDDEAEAQLKREAERRRQHRLAQAAALAAAEQENRLSQENEPEGPKFTEAEIKAKINKLQSALNDIKQKIRRAEANLEHQKGKNISRAPQYRIELKQLRAAKDANEAMLRELESMR